MGAQQRQGNEVVAAKGEHTFAGRQQLLGVSLQLLAHFARVAEGVHQIPAVNHVQAFTHVEVPRKTIVLPGEIGGNLTDRRRAMTAARAPGGRHIERHAGDDPVRIAFIRHKVHWQTQKAKGIGYQGVIVLMT